jgi:hypothetical protein
MMNIDRYFYIWFLSYHVNICMIHFGTVACAVACAVACGLLYMILFRSPSRMMVETFHQRIRRPFQSRSVELYNPSIYSGLYLRKFEVPLAYTRTNVTYPNHTPLSITKKYVTKGTKYDRMTQNLITPLWNVPDVYPLFNRRQILI